MSKNLDTQFISLYEQWERYLIKSRFGQNNMHRLSQRFWEVETERCKEEPLKVEYEYDDESTPEEREARLSRAFKFLFGEYEKWLRARRCSIRTYRMNYDDLQTVTFVLV